MAFVEDDLHFEDEDDEEDEREESEDELLTDDDDELDGPKLGKVLGKQNLVRVNLRTLVDMESKGSINLSPDYQRMAVWSPKQEVDLISSLLLGVSIPHLVFNVQVPDKNNLAPAADIQRWREGDQGDRTALQPREVWACADGKQRLTTVKRFMNGEFALVDKEKTHFYYVLRPRQTRPVLLPESTRRKFDNLTFTCVCYDNLSIELERDLFSRIQQGTPLSASEKLKASPGPMANWIHRLCLEYNAEGSPTAFDIRLCALPRDKDFEVFEQLSLNLMAGFEAATIRPYTALMARLNDPEPSQGQQDAIYTVLDRTRNLTCVNRIPGIKLTMPETKTRLALQKYVPYAKLPHQVWTQPKHVAPVELVWLPSLVKYFSKCTDGELLEIIERWRTDINRKHAGNMKSNSIVSNSIKNWIREFDLKSLKGKYNADGSLTASGSSSGTAPRVPRVTDGEEAVLRHAASATASQRLSNSAAFTSSLQSNSNATASLRQSNAGASTSAPGFAPPRAHNGSAPLGSSLGKLSGMAPIKRVSSERQTNNSLSSALLVGPVPPVPSYPRLPVGPPPQLPPVVRSQAQGPSGAQPAHPHRGHIQQPAPSGMQQRTAAGMQQPAPATGPSVAAPRPASQPVASRPAATVAPPAPATGSHILPAQTVDPRRRPVGLPPRPPPGPFAPRPVLSSSSSTSALPSPSALTSPSARSPSTPAFSFQALFPPAAPPPAASAARPPPPPPPTPLPTPRPAAAPPLSSVGQRPTDDVTPACPSSAPGKRPAGLNPSLFNPEEEDRKPTKMVKLEEEDEDVKPDLRHYQQLVQPEPPPPPTVKRKTGHMPPPKPFSAVS